MAALRVAALALVACCLLCAAPASAFYLPGVAPHSYFKGDYLPLLVNRLDSTESIVPFDYYHFDFCEPGEEQGSAHEGAKVAENLGQIIMGERIRRSPYKLRLEEYEVCEKLCHKTYKRDDAGSMVKYKRLRAAIVKEYMHHWILDNLPVAECTTQCGALDGDPMYRLGFPVGCAIGTGDEAYTICTRNNIRGLFQGEVFINNHINIDVEYHESPEFNGARIVGVSVMPRSRKYTDVNDPCNSAEKNDEGVVVGQPFTMPEGEDTLEIAYTYSVVYKLNRQIKWASRWDTYLRSAEGSSIHWFSIVNSLVIVLFLSGMVGLILVRTLHRDLARYNQESNEDAQEEFGWKLVHGDVFRSPSNPMLLSVCLGNGSQILLMALITLLFACLGFLSPATRGGLMTAMIVLWILLSTTAGYVSSRMYKMFGGEKWKSNVLMTSFLFPSIVFSIFFILNLVLWVDESSAAIPFGTLVAILSLWFLVSVPLTFLGAYVGFKKPPIDAPVRTNQLPRQIPPQSFFTLPLPAIAMGGILPFGCIFIQLFFILNSIWGHKMYYVFGFLFIVFSILVVTTVESTILLCYFHLCAEDYHWWWRSFLTGASSAFPLFIYSIAFYFRRLEADGATNFVLYAGYTFMASMLFFLMTGTVGFFGCFAFVRKIYSVLKVD